MSRAKMPKQNSKILNSFKQKPLLFGVYWLLIFLILFGVAVSIGLISTDENSNENKNENTENLSVNNIIPETPQKIIIEKIGVNTSVIRPNSRDIDTLNNALKDGSVQYPGSGLAGGQNNMLLFGHSSHLPIVLNENYKAFNDLEDLISGDRIIVQGENTEFIYEVFAVSEADAEDFRVDFNTSRRLLTLSTCNNFGDLDDRFVVQAELVGTRSIK